ncbi:variable large family protein [Borreliella andersonii]|uniref:variable large family protein n=1 Tax=Borrelia andersonii TaxID=42109 RepID=UPI003AB5C541
MKKISSVILMAAFVVFSNCKSNAGEVSNANDPKNEFYQSIIKLGNGFLDVFTSFGGLVADAFGLKADPKKSEVQKFFQSIATKIETTITSLTSLPKENGGSTGKTDGGGNEGAVDKAIKEISEKLKAIVDAAEAAAKAAAGDETSIGNVVNANAAAGTADENSVRGIAKGMKAIVDAAKKAAEAATGGEKKLLNAAAGGDATGTGNEAAGHLFSGTNNDNEGADAAQAQKAAGAINAVSGEQILKEIVDAAAKNGAAANGAAANQAENPISAAIGAAQAGADFAAGGMNQNSKVAAAIVLRGMAKDGKFAVNNDAHGNHAAGVKSAVENGVNKTVLALTGIVKAAVDAGLKTIAAAVKGAAGTESVGKTK